MKQRKFEKISLKQFYNDVMCASNLLYEEYKLPQRATRRSAGYDFYSLFDFTLKIDESIILPTGVKVYMQDDEQLDIRIRSSLGFKHGIRIKNQLALIDADYFNNENNEGHIWIALQNKGKFDWMFRQGDAIAQGTFHKYLIVDNDVPVKEERVGGLGSTNSRA